MPERASNKGLVMSVHQKVMVGVVTALILLLVTMVLDTRSQIADLRGSMRVIENEIIHLRRAVETSVEDRYRASQARADLALRDIKISAIRVFSLCYKIL